MEKRRNKVKEKEEQRYREQDMKIARCDGKKKRKWEQREEKKDKD